MKIIKLAIFLIASSCALSACRTVNSQLGCDSTDYSSAQEAQPLKFPANALPVSDRYEIPPIPGNKEAIITEVKPPDY